MIPAGDVIMCIKFTSLHCSELVLILRLSSHTQVGYHLRFSFTPRNAPPKEKSELNPNSDLDWHTLSLFPLFQLPGPREQYDKEGGTPGEKNTLERWTPVLNIFLHFFELFRYKKHKILHFYT